MDKMKQYIPIGLVLALGVKSMISGISVADSAVAVALIGLLTLREYMEKNSKIEEVEERTNKKLAEMSNTILEQNKIIKAQTEEFVKLRDQMSGIKMTFGSKEQPVANPLSRFGVK